MLIFIGWLAFCFVAAAAADARGRSGIAWFVVAFFLSPLIGILLLLVFPNLKHERLLRASLQRPPSLPRSSFLGRADRVTVDRAARPFEPDGVFAGVPYRVAEDGSIHALMQGSEVRFRDFEKFTSALGQS
jgi:hypothetical protein